MWVHLGLVSVVLFASATATTITEFNCTTPDGLWAPNAIACDNQIADSVCETLVTSAPAIKVGTNGDDRAALCNKVGAAPDEQLKQAMIKMCPKTCGYCCLTSAYTCKNKQFPGVTCSTLKQTQCKDPKWREIIASDCPNICGFCNEGGCIDAAIECANDVSICRNIDMQDFVKANCKKTCGFCTNNSTTTISPGGGCMDKSNNCINWQSNGFCENAFYTVLQKQAYCAKTCRLC